MAEKKVTCRYCPNEDVTGVPVPGGTIPLCEAHAAELNRRALNDVDRIMGHPIANVELMTKPGPQPKADF